MKPWRRPALVSSVNIIQSFIYLINLALVLIRGPTNSNLNNLEIFFYDMLNSGIA